MLIGLTGKYCAGKNHVASILEKNGLPVADADKLGYQVLEAEKEAIFAKFGIDLKKPDGGLDRRLLGRKVFGDLKNLSALEAIVHPKVDRLIDEWIDKTGGKACVINAALLHKAAVFKHLDQIILITASFPTRLLRARRRDGLSFRQILKRFSAQRNFNSQYLAVNAEIIRVENPGLSGSLKLQKNLENRIDQILKRII